MASNGVLFCLTALFAIAVSTNVEQCPGGSIEGISEKVQVTPCKRLPCRLKKGTTQHISITFTPDKDLENLKTHVTADVFGVTLPFLGVDGNSACDKISTMAGEKASCPLKAGTQYIYKDSFPVLSIYPSLDTKVHWALQTGSKDVTCFEVPVRIA